MRRIRDENLTEKMILIKAKHIIALRGNEKVQNKDRLKRIFAHLTPFKIYVQTLKFSVAKFDNNYIEILFKFTPHLILK